MWKNRLRAFREMIRESYQIREELEELENRMYTPKGQKFSSMPHSPNTDGHNMDDLVSVHIRLQDAYRGKLAEMEAEQVEIEKALRVLTAEQRMVIRAYYFQMLKWEVVCYKVNYSWRQVHRLHATALDALDKAERDKIA